MSIVTQKKASILERDNWQCWICLYPINPDLKFPDPLSGTVDHIVQQKDGGDNTEENLRAAHMICNIVRSNGFSKKIPLHIKKREFEYGKQINMILEDKFKK